jgi:hypothetical protein
MNHINFGGKVLLNSAVDAKVGVKAMRVRLEDDVHTQRMQLVSEPTASIYIGADTYLVFSVSRGNCRSERDCIIQISCHCLGCAMTLAHFRPWCLPG